MRHPIPYDNVASNGTICVCLNSPEHLLFKQYAWITTVAPNTSSKSDLLHMAVFLHCIFICAEFLQHFQFCDERLFLFSQRSLAVLALWGLQEACGSPTGMDPGTLRH